MIVISKEDLIHIISWVNVVKNNFHTCHVPYGFEFFHTGHQKQTRLQLALLPQKSALFSHWDTWNTMMNYSKISDTSGLRLAELVVEQILLSTILSKVIKRVSVPKKFESLVLEFQVIFFPLNDDNTLELPYECLWFQTLAACLKEWPRRNEAYFRIC